MPLEAPVINIVLADIGSLGKNERHNRARGAKPFRTNELTNACLHAFVNTEKLDLRRRLRSAGTRR